MNVRDVPDVYGYTLFCEDARHEVASTISYIGCYSGTIFIHQEFPFTFPKFCFAITLVQRREIFDPNIEIRIFLPGDPEDEPFVKAAATEVRPGSVIEEVAKKVEGMPHSDQKVIEMHTILVATPLVLKEPGMVQVRAVRKGELIRLGGIRIVPTPAVVRPMTSSNTVPSAN